MRDKTGYKSNFTELIEVDKEGIKRLTQAISSGEANESRRKAIQDAIIEDSIHITIAQYSTGNTKDVVTIDLLDSIKAFEEGFKWGGVELGYGQYEQMLWLVCLGLLCDIPADDFRRITNIIKRDGVKDKLLDFIIHGKLGNEWPVTAHNYIEPSPYKNVDSLSSAAELKQYLSKVWYNGQVDAAWHNSHLNTKVNTYFGYWAWETAAIVKLKGIEDSSLKEQKYYPYDAVHW